MIKKIMVHIITNFSGVGGAEMMLSRLIECTQDQFQHVIISLMHTSDFYEKTLAQCQTHFALGWNGINTLGVIKKLRQLLQRLQPQTVQCWMYHANALTSLSVLGLKTKPKVVWGFIIP